MKIKKNSTRSPVGMRLLFLLDIIISCFLKNNKFEDISTKKEKRDIDQSSKKLGGGYSISLCYLYYNPGF